MVMTRVAAEWLMRRIAVPWGLGILLLVVQLPEVGAQQPPKIMTVGESNAPYQVAELLTYFGAPADAPFVPVTLVDTQRAMEGIFDTSDITSAYSSTALTCRPPGAGLEVTTRNITVVTPGLYAMALAAAGIDDATLAVAAPDDAPAEGMTALTGVFATWETGPCPSGATDATRQRLALEELALTVDIGRGLGTADGVRTAADLVLGIHRDIVEGRITDRSAIDTVIAQHATAMGADIPAAQREGLVALMTRMASTQIDWGTFAAGWKLEQSPDAASIAMTGTSVGGPASVASNPTATVDIQATAQVAARSATEAVPSSTPAPSPTPTPVPYTVNGTVVDNRGDHLGVVLEDGGAPVAYAIDASIPVERAGQPATTDQIAKHDRVTMTVDGNSGRMVTAIAAQPPPASLGSRLAGLWPVLLAGMLILAAAAAVLRRKRGGLAPLARSSCLPVEPTVVRSRRHAARVVHRVVRLRPRTRAHRANELPS